MRAFPALLVVSSVACGPGAALEPLIGEDELTFQVAQMDGLRLFDDAPSIRARELIGHLGAGQWQRAWARLGPAARAAATARIGASETPGPAILEGLSRQGIDPVNLLVGVHPVRVTVIPPGGGDLEPPSSFVPGDGRVIVFAYAADGAIRSLTMVYDDGDWKLESSDPVAPQS
ncbi:MAG: hypothetical protein AMXMBFR64_52090 [Myxococcales bacterium]